MTADINIIKSEDYKAMNSNGGSSFFGSDWLGAFLIIAILFGGGLWGGTGGAASNVATTEYVQHAISPQGIQDQLQQIALSSANNNYETAQLINAQTNAMLQQNNTNLINAIQGFNQVNQNMLTGFSGVQNAISQLGYHLDQCCCDIKTQMLQNRLDDANAALVAARGDISNAAQTQVILSTMGKWVANPAATTA